MCCRLPSDSECVLTFPFSLHILLYTFTGISCITLCMPWIVEAYGNTSGAQCMGLHQRLYIYSTAALSVCKYA